MDAGRKVSTFCGVPVETGVTNGPAIGPRFSGLDLENEEVGAAVLGMSGVAVDAGGGVVYVSDPSNHVIRRVQGGQVTTFVGIVGQSGYEEGSAAEARLNQPKGMVVDPAGNLYVADFGNHAIRKVSLNGVVSTVAGLGPDGAGSTDGGLGEGALNGPVALAIDASGKLYVADQGNDLIRRLVPTTAQQSTVFNLETVAGLRGIDSVLDGPVESAAFSLPSAIAMSPDGQKIYVSDQSENVPLIRLVDLQAGQVSLVHELPQPDIVAAGNAPYFPDEALPNLPLVGGIAIDPSGGLIVTSTFDSAVYRIPLDGGPLVQIGGADVMDPLLGGEPGNRGGSGTESRFFVPAGVAVAGNGAVYVANAGAASLVSAVPPSQTVPALTSPVSDAVLSGSISVAFTLPERAQPGSLRVLFKSRAASREVVVSDTLGVAGNASLTIQASNPGGSFNVSGVVPAGAKIPSGVYTVQVVYRSQSGQLRQSPIANRVSIDAETGLPKLLSPAARATFTANVPVSFVLPEAAAAGSLNLVFDDGFNPRTLVLAGSQETAGNHSFDLNPQEPLNGGFVVSGDPVPPGSYKVSLFYRDQQMNDEAVATSSGVLIRGTQPVLVLPQANTVSRAPVPVQFSLPAPAKAGTLRLRFTNSSSEVRELVLGSVLERLGGRFDFDPASPAGSSTAVVSGPSIPDGEYSVQVNYQSALGAQTIGPVAGFRIDTATQPPTGLTFSDGSPGAAQIQFTLPEAAQAGSVIAAFRPVGGTGSVPKLVLGEQNESAGLHTVQVDLRGPEANTAQIRGGDPVPNGVYELVVAYNDVLGNPRAFARTSATVVNGAELIPFRVGYGRQGSGTPLVFTFTLSAQSSSPMARLVFRKEDTQEVSELVLARSFSDGVESTVGFDPANTALGGQFSSGPAILLPGTYGVRLKYARSDSSEPATSRELTGVRVLSGVSVGSPQIAVESGVLTGTRLSADPQGSPFFGFSFLRFGVPSSTGDGGLAYQATYVNPSSERFRGVFVSDSLEPIAVQRGEAPGAGSPYLLFGTPVVNRSGDLAFAALLDAEDPESGLWVRRSGILSLVFRASQPVTGASASQVFLDGVTNIALADNGDLFFTALRSEPVPEGTDPEDEEGVPKVFSLWRQNSSGQIAELLSTGSLVGVGSGQDRVVNKITAFGAMPDTPGQRRGFNKNGDLVVRVDFTDQTAALVKFTSGSLTPVVVLKTGSQNLAGESVNIGNLGLVSLGDDGGMVVRIGLVQDGTGVTPDNDQMLVAISNTSVATILAQEGDQITAGGNAVVLKSVGNPVGGQAGRYAFVGSISAVPAEGQTAPQVADPVILKKNGSGFDVLARRGGTVPGVTGAQFNQIRSLAWPGNEGGYGPAFVASLKTGGGVTSANDVGLWAQNSGGTVVLLLREGDTLLSGAAKKTVRLFSVLSAVSGSASQGHSTVGEGTYAVRVVFTDLTEAVINVSVP
jgi:flagellar hook assembly protein FlgD